MVLKDHDSRAGLLLVIDHGLDPEGDPRLPAICTWADIWSAPERKYPEGTITCPLMCDWQVFTVDDVLERMAGETDEAAPKAD